jgi:hypothetical protein
MFGVGKRHGLFVAKETASAEFKSLSEKRKQADDQAFPEVPKTQRLSLAPFASQLGVVTSSYLP